MKNYNDELKTTALILGQTNAIKSYVITGAETMLFIKNPLNSTGTYITIGVINQDFLTLGTLE